MILPVHAILRQRLGDLLTSLYGLPRDAQPTLAIEVPPRRALGDLALPFAFELARSLRKAPRVIAQEVAAAVGPVEGVARVEAAPNGYLNVFLDRAPFLRARLGSGTPPAPLGTLLREKTIVEHTAINPNKAAHIGHLRNSAMGDTLVRLLRFSGVPVEVQNYIDDTGVQVADVVVGFQHIEPRTLDQVKALAASTRFDYYCWDLYARVTEWYEADKSRLDIRAATLHAIEHGEGDAAAMGAFVAEHIVRCHLKTMARLNIDYDLLTWEGDILRLHFWATAFEILKRNNSIYLQEDGPLRGCWVMRIDDDIAGVTDEARALAAESADPMAAGAADAESKEKVIVRSNGTVTYVGKDIANQFWKFGLLGKDFHYRPFATRMDGATLYASTSDATQATGGVNGVPHFGDARAVYNVIDSRQAYLQRLLKQALAAMGYREQADRSTHFAYEMVALSHATAREFGFVAEADADRPFVEVSGRKGLGVKADDLIDRLIAKASAEVGQRNPTLTDAEVRETAQRIAIAALRYFMVKFSRGKIIAFDIDEALSFEGESGPYIQYAVVRAANIFSKLQDRHGMDEAGLVASLEGAPTESFTSGSDADDLWALALDAARLDEIVETAVRTLEPSVLAKYAFTLAQGFNAAYHRFPIVNEEDAGTRAWRGAVAAYVRRQLTQALALIGSDVPARM